MKRIILGLVAATALVVPGVAGASSAAGCSAHDMTWKTPGKMFQTARTDLGVTPAQLAGVHSLSVGQLIAAGCRS